MSQLMFPSKRLCAQTRMLHTWIAFCLLLQGSGWVSGDTEAQQTEGAAVDHQVAPGHGMTEEQKAFLKWYYRTEDPSSWKYSMLGLSFGALLLGSVLLVIGTMANRSRKKLAQYKAAALAVQREELQGLTEVTQACSTPPQAQTPIQADTSKDTQTSQESKPLHISEPLESQPDFESPQDSGQTKESGPTDAISQETDGNGS
ncbi:hypothetical protein ANANG_G00207830 [Anguilla anguilla]|uniref:Transmembrane protein n=1 Tax=Anguilla anguilla TaxID=7936 RepID=A0A9D3M165_ANGAN|nr:hypothetical protein ANANG_G00207830 [Anguilla anguilla]